MGTDPKPKFNNLIVLHLSYFMKTSLSLHFAPAPFVLACLKKLFLGSPFHSPVSGFSIASAFVGRGPSRIFNFSRFNVREGASNPSYSFSFPSEFQFEIVYIITTVISSIPFKFLDFVLSYFFLRSQLPLSIY